MSENNECAQCARVEAVFTLIDSGASGEVAEEAITRAGLSSRELIEALRRKIARSHAQSE